MANVDRYDLNKNLFFKPEHIETAGIPGTLPAPLVKTSYGIIKAKYEATNRICSMGVGDPTDNKLGEKTLHKLASSWQSTMSGEKLSQEATQQNVKQTQSEQKQPEERETETIQTRSSFSN